VSLTTDGAPPDLVRPAYAAGTMIADRYRIETQLGAGGGGTVFRCTDVRLNAVVALKIVTPDADLERLRREVAMARQITDRNVCRVHDLGETGELRFVTMELVEGASLRSKIRPDLPAEEARALIEQLVAGVAAIHASGVVHRDLKPENVVVAVDGRAVMVDFGLAKTRRASWRRCAVARARPGGHPCQDRGRYAGTCRRSSRGNRSTRGPTCGHWPRRARAVDRAMPEQGDYGPVVSPLVDRRWPGFAAVLGGCLALDPAARFTNASTLRVAIAQGGYTPPPYASGSAPTMPSGPTMSSGSPNASGSASEPTIQSRPNVPVMHESASAPTMQRRPIHAPRPQDASNPKANAAHALFSPVNAPAAPEHAPLSTADAGAPHMPAPFTPGLGGAPHVQPTPDLAGAHTSHRSHQASRSRRRRILRHADRAGRLSWRRSVRVR
jgi:serine/threonine protein kinase